MQDQKRLKELIETASRIVGNDTKLAEVLGRPKQHVSNWKNGHKTPSIEVQADLAAIANLPVHKQVLMALIEDAEGDRKERLQAAFRKLLREEDTRETKPTAMRFQFGQALSQSVGNLYVSLRRLASLRQAFLSQPMGNA